MSPELHPDWQNEPGERPVRVSIRPSDAVQPQMVSVSRRPAAIVGILLVLGAVTSVYGVRDLFSGQLPANPPKETQTTQKNVVHITDNGMEPSTLTVQQGDTITWQNDSAIPHILSSDTLLTEDGPLETPAIFTGATLEITVPKTAPVGTYTYISLTSSLSGSVIVVAGTQTSSSKTSASSSSADTVFSPSSSSAALSSSSSSAAPFPVNPFPGQTGGPQVPVIPTTPVGMIPTNPYALGQRNTAVSSSRRTTTAQSSSLHAGAPAVTTHKPVKQPASGPAATGMMIAGSLLLLVVFSRKALTKGAFSL